MKYYLLTSSEKLNEIPVETGNLIFDEVGRTIYLDGLNGRAAYTEILLMDSEEQMKSLPNPIDGFYFTKDSNVLWRKSGENWIQLTTSPDPQIVFMDRGDFPAVGKENVIYVSGVVMYRWYGSSYIKLDSGVSPEWQPC